MRYGHFDDAAREYVIDRVDVPVSWTNYLGVGRMGAVLNHTAGGYAWMGSPQFHRVTRFRPNGVPMDGPGHYVYVRDDEDGAYWSLSWQPVGLPLDRGAYQCRHGLGYSTYACEARGIAGTQTMFIPVDDDLEIWDVRLTNRSDRPRALSVFGYVEFSFHLIDMDNQNFQMSLYASGSRLVGGAVECELHYEPDSYQYFTMNGAPDSMDGLRDAFIGPYRTEKNPVAVENGRCSGSAELTGNHCGALHKRVTLAPGETVRLTFFLGQGDAAAARAAREKYDGARVDAAQKALRRFWDARLQALTVQTPHPNLDTSLNIWNLYQAEINVLFSRFASFIEVGGRTGLGFRDTAQDAMCIPHADPDGCRWRLMQLLRGQAADGFGLHLFDPAWFEEQSAPAFKSPTVVPVPDVSERGFDLKDVCSDDALWLVAAVCEYARETGDAAWLDTEIPFADSGADTVYGHIRRALDFSWAQRGENGICLGLRADWNDCLNLGGGQSAMVSFLYVWASEHFVDLARWLGRDEDAARYDARRAEMTQACQTVLWDGAWFLRGFTADGRAIGTDRAAEGKVHLESNAWAVLSGAATDEQAARAMNAMDEYLFTRYGLMLNAPCFETVDDAIGFVPRVYPGVKENGAIFSHSNPWAWAAACRMGQGARAMKFIDALLPGNQNDDIGVRQSEPYSYCQFVMGTSHSAHGRARHPWMTGSAGWAYYAATRFLLGIRPGFRELIIDPCIPAEWDGFKAVRVWRGARYEIEVINPNHVEKGVTRIEIDGAPVTGIPPFAPGRVHCVKVTMG